MPAIPCLQGPIGSLVSIQGTINFIVGAGTEPGQLMTQSVNGLAVVGYDADGYMLSGNLPSGNLLACTCQLQCYNIGAGGNEWRGRVFGTWLAPQGDLVNFDSGPLQTDQITDLSVPGNYNLVEYYHPGNGSGGMWDCDWLRVKWYTAGAPI